MPNEDPIKAGQKRAGRNAVALAVAALLANSSAPAQSNLGQIVDRAKQSLNQSTSKATPPLVIRPSSSVIQLGHASHASHTSHYSSSTGGGGDMGGSDNSGGGDSQNNPAPSQP